MNDYLPDWATLDEASAWLQARTGGAWPLSRLIEAGLTPHVWLEPNGENLQNAAVFEKVFDRRPEGFLAPMVFAGDTHRLAIDRSVTLSMTRTPRGDLVRFTPPASADLVQLRFAATDVRGLAATPAEDVAPAGQPRRRWTPELLAELAAYREQHGTKAAGVRFGISRSRVRALQPRDKPRPSQFPGVVHRAR